MMCGTEGKDPVRRVVTVVFGVPRQSGVSVERLHGVSVVEQAWTCGAVSGLRTGSRGVAGARRFTAVGGRALSQHEHTCGCFGNVLMC